MKPIENIDYILLNILKYYKKSELKTIVIHFNNTKNDRLLFEIIKRNLNKFDNVIVECYFEKYEKLFNSILTKEEKDKIIFKSCQEEIIKFLQTTNLKNFYKISAKDKLYCRSFLKFNYNNSDLYPLFNFTEEEIDEMLNFLKVTDNFEKENYGENIDIKLLNQYLTDYTNFIENNNKEEISEILNFVKKQNNLKTKIIPSLKQVKEIEKQF